MAVYTHLSAETLAELIGHYDIGELVSAKGIAEGVSNSNWLIETARDSGETTRYILTMYERRIDLDELPFFLSLLDHLSAKGTPVPRTIHDRAGNASREVDGKTVALIEFLPGVSVDRPTPAQAFAVGEALARIHLAATDFTARRANSLGPIAWRDTLNQCGQAGLASIDPALPDIALPAMEQLIAQWPRDLPRSIIHADLFPDNVLMLGNTVSGLIDFYFACEDMMAYDLAVTHAAWCFPNGTFDQAIAAQLLAGYQSVRPLSEAEIHALPVLGRGAAMRFLSSRAIDWIETPDDALVTRKDPMQFAARLSFYGKSCAAAFPLSNK